MSRLIGGDYCPICGQKLICSDCNGTGKVGQNISTTFCCGAMRSSNYCPICGKSLISNYSKETMCLSCWGTGRIPHITCPGIKMDEL